MTVRIERVHAHIVEMRVGFTYSSGTLDVGRAIIWEVVAGSLIGLGECGLHGEESTPGVKVQTDSGELIDEDQKRMIDGLVSAMLGQEIGALEGLLPDIPRESDCDFLVAREGLSIAIHDLAGKVYGVPVHALLGGKRRDRAPGMPVTHVGPPEVMARRSKSWLDAGYQYLKVKFRGSLEEDVEALRLIRETVGRDTAIVVDANSGYKKIEDAERAIRGLESVRPQYFEDMLDASVEEMAELRRRTGARTMADREARWPMVYEVCRLGAADVINHHPNRQGGLQTALAIDAVAAAAGLETAIGSSGLFGIQDAAFQQLSSVISLTRPCEDIGILPYYSGPTQGEYAFDREPTVVANPYPIENGTLHIPDTPGLGVELDRKRLRDFTVGTLEFK